ncbi:MAG: SDR family oxidoreductase [Gloeomargarita sp. SKYBB_i_bin120]|nr:SDR family oxidoreductase [Gloeomargarita sp. SKYG98]MCS7292327.1 SDR family oxidoreductase [Gloeomargarita sp. SKYB120]MDW8177887.1 SDR family oxidoreductase [Gloeomargarita sp. SKYBB_i_bin120]
MLQGKVVVVVGATGGIGRAVVQRLQPLGAKLVLAARHSERLQALGVPGALCIPTDITVPVQVEQLMSQAVHTFGRIDVLVNAAGAGVFKSWDKLTPEDLASQLAVNLQGNFYAMQAAAQVMKTQRSGHICNVIGILGKHTMPLAAAYCASKFGAVGFSKVLADELRRYNIKVTLFYFGGVDTPFWDNITLKVDRSKMLRPETAADAIVYALQMEPAAVPMEVNIQPESHLFI